MENITYLLGAGASRNCLPIVSEMSKMISEVHGEFERGFNQLKMRDGTQIDQAQGNLLMKDFQWLTDVCNIKKNFSVDTFAKKLRLSNKTNEYERLKNILTVYFTLQQKFKPPDIRYDNYWASLLTESNKFPSNIKILSWNYDFQMELTYQDFINSSSLIDTSKNLNVFTHRTIKNDSLINDFTIFKLNGSATYNSDAVDRGHNYVVDDIKDCSTNDAIIKAIDYYAKSNWRSVLPLHTHLSYAWEHDKEGVFYKKLQESLKSTTILVVIGYSFPYFNRDVDKLILNKYMPFLKKAYFQDEKPDNIRERFTAINNSPHISDLVSIHDTYQFYFPNEL